jgi:hypothetical protein
MAAGNSSSQYWPHCSFLELDASAFLGMAGIQHRIDRLPSPHGRLSRARRRWYSGFIDRRPRLSEKQLRLSILTLCLVLVACSSHREDLPTAVINPPDPSKVTASLRSVAAQAKIEEPLEVSAPIQANPTSSIPWMICLRSGATEESKRHTYAAFFKNNDYVSSRWSVIIDHCETQVFSPLAK